MQSRAGRWSSRNTYRRCTGERANDDNACTSREQAPDIPHARHIAGQYTADHRPKGVQTGWADANGLATSRVAACRRDPLAQSASVTNLTPLRASRSPHDSIKSSVVERAARLMWVLVSSCGGAGVARRAGLDYPEIELPRGHVQAPERERGGRKGAFTWARDDWMALGMVVEHDLRSRVDLVVRGTRSASTERPRAGCALGVTNMFAICVTTLLGACGGETTTHSGSGGVGGSADPCAAYPLQAAPAEIAKTPRTNEDAEVLAIETAGTLVAPEALYQSVATELAAAIALDYTVFVIHPRTSVFSKNPLRLGFDAVGSQLVLSGAYDEWDCPNQAYGGTPSILSQGEFVDLSFGAKRYHAKLLEQEYGTLSHVTSSHQDTYTTDGPDVCLEIQAEQHFYIFDQASGDCESGCMDHRYFGFQASPGSGVTALGIFEPKTGSPEPAWFAALADCRTRL